jgi:acyl-homoserine lactone acylase PvdQ
MISTFGAVQDPSMFVIDGGQSANIFDPHYDDLMELHEKGEFLLMWPQASSQPKVKIARHKKSEDSKKSLRPEDL